MPRREPTVRRPELMVACPDCRSVRGAAYYGTTGRPMKGVHKERAQLHREQYPA